jgi:hypothetical protein
LTIARTGPRLFALLAVAVTAAACARPAATTTAQQPPAPPPTSASAAPSPSASPVPVVEHRTVTQTRSIPYRTVTVQDPNLASGSTRTRVQGVPGIRTLTYDVTYTDGVETGRTLVRQVTTRAPVNKVVAVGTKKSNCDPNYSGACVPIASDVDCAGGSGNGPAYVRGPVYVIGTDIYDLDRDGDGVGCD